MEFGCAFNPRPAPGRCIKDPRYNKVDKECEVSGTACRLISLPPLIRKEEVKSETKPEAKATKEVKPQKGTKGKISGPISANYTQYANKVYNFYGDAHFSMENTCQPCKDFRLPSLELSNPPGSESCWDISRLLADVFTKASKEGKWVDFYIEIPFMSREGFKPSSKEVQKQVSKLGYLYKLYYIFYNCLHKFDCLYDTTRFHYVDVRLEYHSVDLPQMTREMELLLSQLGEVPSTFRPRINNYEMHVSAERLQNSVQELQMLVMSQKRERIPYIEETDRLMKDLYFSGGQTMAGRIEPKNKRLFVLYLTSDNFAEDAYNLMKESIGNDRELGEILVPPKLLVNRRGKNMQRIRAQIEALEHEGMGEFAKKLTDFLIQKYNNRVDNSSVIDLWRSVMTTYEGYINARYRSLNDVYALIGKIKKETEKILKLFGMSVSGSSLLMDAYTLARMFRTYQNKTHIDSSQVIVYAGDAHIDTYNDFFEVLKSPITKYEPNRRYIEKREYDKISRCLDVDLSLFL